MVGCRLERELHLMTTCLTHSGQKAVFLVEKVDFDRKAAIFLRRCLTLTSQVS